MVPAPASPVWLIHIDLGLLDARNAANVPVLRLAVDAYACVIVTSTPIPCPATTVLILIIPLITPRAVVCTRNVAVVSTPTVAIAGAIGGDADQYSTDHRANRYSGRGTGTPTPTAPPHAQGLVCGW
jgi:hypothetical protein